MALALLLLAAALAATARVASPSCIGINYGQVADNLPSPSAVLPLLRSINITRVKLYDADPRVLAAFCNAGDIDIVVGVPDRLLPRFAAVPGAAAAWVRSSIPDGVAVSAITVGNEVLSRNDPAMSRSLLPAMQSLRDALDACGVRAAVTTAHSLAVLQSSFPPSAAAFRREIDPYMAPLLSFLANTSSPFFINAYPYFAYKASPATVDINYTLFEPNSGVVDAATGLRYSNMLHAQVDAVRAAIGKVVPGAERNISIVVSETGWPSMGDDDEVGATPENAARYNGNLMRTVAEGRGTPAAPKEALPVYVFALFNENLKPGPASERHYGLFKPDMSPAYELAETARGWKSNDTGAGSGLAVAAGTPELPPTEPGYYTADPSSQGEKATRWTTMLNSLFLAAVFMAILLH